MKIKLLNLIIFFNFFKLFVFDDFSLKYFYQNPYRILGIEPWSSIEKIKEVYHKKILETHPDKIKGKTKEFIEIQNAYQNIKEYRKKHKNISLKKIISKTFKDTFMICIIFIIFYFFSFLSYKIQSKIFKPLIIQIITFNFFNIFIPHWFNNYFHQYLNAFFIGIVIYVLLLIIKKIKNKNNIKKF